MCQHKNISQDVHIVHNITHKINTNISIKGFMFKYWYTLPAKNMEYFSFQWFFLYFVWCVGYIFIWFAFLQADITFGELIHTQ